MVASVDMAGFNSGISGLQRALGIDVRSILEKEAGELVKTLVRISPPKYPAKTREDIKSKINFTFNAFSKESGFSGLDGAVGPSGLKWYASNSKFLFGGSPDNDMRKASQAELLRVHYSAKVVQKHARLILPFKGRQTSQRVALMMKIIASRKQINGVISRVQKHVGRLKAGWLAGVTKGLIRISGGYMPPSWVTRHTTGALGNCAVDFGNPASLSITISNKAKGVSSRASLYFVQSAISIRAKAMAAKVARITSGRANNYLADYANH